jgi:hypothetical protein
MVINILIDLSHNEQITSFPEHIFPESSLMFHFNNISDDLTQCESLPRYDLIILGNPRPKSKEKYLFTPEELISLKKFVSKGGNLLITSSAHGDFDCDHASGSLRVFYRLTGVQQYYNAVLYSQRSDEYCLKKTNLIINKFPEHPIFENFGPEDYIISGRSTYFILHPEISPDLTLYSPPDIYFHDFLTKKKLKITKAPLLTAHQYSQGKIITTASSSFLTKNKNNGIHGGSNTKFLQGCLKWFFPTME